MREEIDWKKELLESGRFNDKFQKNLLEDGAKNFLQGIFLGYIATVDLQPVALDEEQGRGPRCC